jgi:hypothetical protein
MEIELINNISTVAFLVVVGFMALVSLMAIYIFNRYGQNKSLTLTVSLVFAGLFLMGTVSAFVALQKLF